MSTLVMWSVLCLTMGGCLKRTLSITTEPPGALVWLNDTEIGRTPLETDFTFYGTYDVRIRREGYEPIQTHQKARAPVSEWPGIDLVSEALPVQLHNVVRWHWALTPLAENSNKPEAEAALIDRARELRQTATNFVQGASELPSQAPAQPSVPPTGQPTPAPSSEPAPAPSPEPRSE